MTPITKMIRPTSEAAKPANPSAPTPPEQATHAPLPGRTHPGIRGKLPYQPGEILGSGGKMMQSLPKSAVFKPDDFTPDEVTRLTELGFKPGDVIPHDLPQRLAQAQAEQFALHSEIKPDRPPTALPEIKKLEDQPPAYQKELRNFLSEAERIQQNIRDEEVKEGEQLVTPNLILTMRPVAKAEPEPPPSPPDPEPEAPPEPAGSEAPPLPPMLQQALTAHSPEQKNCPFCRHDLSRPVIEEPTAAEMQEFFGTMHGGRFKKSYTFYQGKITIRFRSLTTAEADQAMRQIIMDSGPNPLKAGERSEEIYVASLNGYRMTAALEAIQIEGQSPLLFGTLDQFDCGPPASWAPQTNKIKVAYEYILDTYLQSESLRRNVLLLFDRFDMLCAIMELRMMDPKS